MATKWHKAVTKYLLDYGKLLHTKGKIARVRTGGKPININHPDYKIPPIRYKPEVYFIYKSRRITVFEVVDTQNNDGVHSDVIKSFIADDVTSIFFIVNNSNRAKEVWDESDIIFKKTLDLFDCLPINKKSFRIRVLNVPKSQISSNKYLFNILQKEKI